MGQGKRLKRERGWVGGGVCVCVCVCVIKLWLARVAVWQKPTQYCKAIIRQCLLDSVGEGAGGKIWENGIETCILSYVKQIASPAAALG